MIAGNPFLINTVELRRSVGNQREFAETVAIDDLALPSVRVRAGSELRVELLLETLSGGVAVTGTVSGTWQGECRRCLDPVDGVLVVEIAEVYEDHPTEGETYPISGDHLDLEPMVRELTLLGLPIDALCRTDCVGPLPDEFPVAVAEDDVLPPSDPRWAALDALRDN